MMNMFKDPSAIEDMDENSMQDPQQMMKMMKKLGGNKALKQAMKHRKR